MARVPHGDRARAHRAGAVCAARRRTGDNVAEGGEALVDELGLLECLAAHLAVLDPLRAREVDQVELALGALLRRLVGARASLGLGSGSGFEVRLRVRARICVRIRARARARVRVRPG